MTRRGALAAVALAAAAAGCAGAGANRGTRDAPRPRYTHVVHIRGFQFVPKDLTVAAGDSVAWINDDALPHTSTADSRAWQSPELAKGAAWGTVVMSPGTMPYHCAAHEVMRGSLTVK